MSKTRLIMKRLCNVKPGDVMVGKDGWRNLESIREIIGVYPSKSKPGKLRLEYRLPDRCTVNTGKMRRWPDFYVICIKQ